jgi:glycosyltransferase involved in cell wall biosynthesis
MTPPFSVLMAVYAGDERDYLRRAVLSNTLEQTCVPTQLVIVRDGPVPASIQAFLDGLDVWLGKAFAQVGRHDSLPEITVLELARNSGLAHALNQGLRRCRYDLVARADSDDISLPARFATIIPLLDGPHGESHRAPQHDSRGEREHVGHYDIVGSAIREFSGDERHPWPGAHTASRWQGSCLISRASSRRCITRAWLSASRRCSASAGTLSTAVASRTICSGSG